MARKPRLWYPGATYHLMERGIRRQAIYSDYTDYQTFLAILKRSLKKYSCTLHAFCLMTNHFHLLLETSDTPVGSFMKHLACTYATYYNRKQCKGVRHPYVFLNFFTCFCSKRCPGYTGYYHCQCYRYRQEPFP